MKGEIVLTKKGVFFLQLETGQSYSIYSIERALKDSNFYQQNFDLANLMFAAYHRIKAGQTGPVCSADADKYDPDYNK